MRDLHGLRYLGIDVIDDLLRYAAEIAQRKDWTFKKSTTMETPAVDNSQDVVCAFSEFIHLLHEETYFFLKEIKRVLKLRGRCVFSFLDFSVPAHWTVFEMNLQNINQRSVLSLFSLRTGPC